VLASATACTTMHTAVRVAMTSAAEVADRMAGTRAAS